MKRGRQASAAAELSGDVRLSSPFSTSRAETVQLQSRQIEEAFRFPGACSVVTGLGQRGCVAPTGEAARTPAPCPTTCARSTCPSSTTDPVIRAGRLPRYPFRGLLGVQRRCGPAWSLNRPSPMGGLLPAEEAGGSCGSTRRVRSGTTCPGPPPGAPPARRIRAVAVADRPGGFERQRPARPERAREAGDHLRPLGWACWPWRLRTTRQIIDSRRQVADSHCHS